MPRVDRLPVDAQEHAAEPARRSNVVIELRDAYTVLNSLVIPRLARHGHHAVRPAHSAVFEHIDRDGTTVSTLAQRAQMTKQAMAELVRHLERHGYVVRVPDPTDRRAKLVTLTDTGQEIVRIAEGLLPEAEQHLTDAIGRDRLDALRHDLRVIHAATLSKYAAELNGLARQ